MHFNTCLGHQLLRSLLDLPSVYRFTIEHSLVAYPSRVSPSLVSRPLWVDLDQCNQAIHPSLAVGNLAARPSLAVGDLAARSSWATIDLAILPSLAAIDWSTQPSWVAEWDQATMPYQVIRKQHQVISFSLVEHKDVAATEYSSSQHSFLLALFSLLFLIHSFSSSCSSSV